MDTEEKYLERLEILVEEEDFALAEALVGQALSYGWEEESLATGQIKLTLHCEDGELLNALAVQIRNFLPEAQCLRSKIVQADWTNAWKEYFTPIEAGDFVILPPWLAKSYENPQKLYPIVIEPKSAFGTGHHASTVLCLKAITALYHEGKIRAGQRFLDLGTGTGILGIACTHYGLTGCGLDIESLAVDNAKENCVLNSVKDFTVGLGSIEKVQGLQFDVVIANILAQPLREMAEDIINAVSPNHMLILSGFLGIQVADLEKAYERMGKARQFRQETDMKDGEWVSLYWG
ncbi:MAG: 50S ribosomal protein L11 methyltransferase [Mailhella sp.]|nr:50S ribosomal protein L11 methyltransferase [Mailhella sp.]